MMEFCGSNIEKSSGIVFSTLQMISDDRRVTPCRTLQLSECKTKTSETVRSHFTAWISSIVTWTI